MPHSSKQLCFSTISCIPTMRRREKPRTYPAWKPLPRPDTCGDKASKPRFGFRSYHLTGRECYYGRKSTCKGSTKIFLHFFYIVKGTDSFALASKIKQVRRG